MCCCVCFSRDAVLRWCNRINRGLNFTIALLGAAAAAYAVFLVYEDGWRLSLFSGAVGGWGALLCTVASAYAMLGYRSICCGCWYSAGMFGFAALNGVGVALALVDKGAVVAYIEKHARGAPSGLWKDVDKTLEVTLYVVAGVSGVMVWAATIALCHRRRLVEADADAFDSYVGLGGDEEPEAYSRGRRYDRLHADRRSRRGQRAGGGGGGGGGRRTPTYRSNQTAAREDELEYVEDGGGGFMDNVMDDHRPNKHERYGFGKTREAPINMPKTGNPFM
jgi:hypothetical protein